MITIAVGAACIGGLALAAIVAALVIGLQASRREPDDLH